MAHLKGIDRTERPFSFAVVGDTHFARPEFFPPTDRPRNPNRAEVIEASLENVRYSLIPMMESLKKAEPAFVVLTGELAETDRRGEEGQADLQAALSFFEGFDLPVIPIRGNHDRAEDASVVLRAHLSKTFGLSTHEDFFHFDAAGCRFVMVDTTEWHAGGAQEAWLERLLSRSASDGVDRTFLFGHHPVWPLARAFFTNQAYHTMMPEILSRHRVDALFCSHTHHQSVVLHTTSGGAVLQCMSAPIGVSDEMPTPLDRVHSQLPDQQDLLESWPGYLEHTAPGWFIVHVDPHRVRVEWHHLNRGVEVTAAWQRAGDIQEFWQMEHPPEARLVPEDLKEIRRAGIRYCAWDAIQPGKQVLLNGEGVGVLPPAGRYASRRMELPPWALAGIRMENLLEIQAPEDEASTVGNLILEATLPGGRIVRTRPGDDIFTWSDRWESWGHPALRKVAAGKPIRTRLCFR